MKQLSEEPRIASPPLHLSNILSTHTLSYERLCVIRVWLFGRRHCIAIRHLISVLHEWAGS